VATSSGFKKPTVYHGENVRARSVAGCQSGDATLSPVSESLEHTDEKACSHAMLPDIELVQLSDHRFRKSSSISRKSLSHAALPDTNPVLLSDHPSRKASSISRRKSRPCSITDRYSGAVTLHQTNMYFL